MFRWSASWGYWPITHEVPSGRDTHSACGSSARSPRPPARLDLMRTRDRARGIPTIKTRMGNEAQVLALTELRVEGQRMSHDHRENVGLERWLLHGLGAPGGGARALKDHHGQAGAWGGAGEGEAGGMKREWCCVLPGSNTQEGSGSGQGAGHLRGGVPRWLHPPPPAPLSAPCAVPSLRPASCLATSLSGCLAALPAHSQPGGHQEAEAGQPGVRECSLAAPGPKFASSPGRPSGRYASPAAPSRILTRALLHQGTELRPGQLQGGDAATGT